MKRFLTYTILAALLAAASSCSTTKRLADDQVLYVGVRKIEIGPMDDGKSDGTVDGKKSSRAAKVPGSGRNADSGEVGNNEGSGGKKVSRAAKVPGSVSAAVKGPLSVKPNNPLWSPYVRTPLPTGLWVWNYMYTDRKTGFRAWVYRTFGKQPVLMEQVMPEARTGMVEDILDNLGYFGSEATYETVPRKNPKKSRVSYSVRVARPWFYETVEFPAAKDTLTRTIAAMQARSNLRPGQQYNIDTLKREQVRITNALRNSSYYYFRPDYIEYFADTTRVSYGVDLKLRLAEGIPLAALQPYNIGRIDMSLFSADGLGAMDSLSDELMSLRYQQPLKIRPKVLERAFTFKPGEPAAVRNINRTLTNLTRIGVFRYVNLSVTPLDSLRPGDRLDMDITAAFDTPMEAEVEVDFASKSNSFLGPALILGLKHKNLFRGGETFAVRFNGSYEWQTGNRSASANSSAVNSYELGLTAALTLPRMVVPRFIDRAMEYGGTTSYSLSANFLNRPQYFRMLSASFANTYDFRTSPTVTHSFTPFKMVFNRMLRRTAEFDAMMQDNPALGLSFRDQFIPSGTYTYTFDKRLGHMRRDRFTWQVSLTSAGNLWAGVYSLAGVKGQKNIFGLPFSQFFKETTEVKYFKQVARVNTFAVRFFAGAAHAYGNSSVLPYTEQFYIGGAYSIRAFTIRSIGPGSYRDSDPKTGFLTQTGDFKLELNAEMRFRIAGGLNGAVFIDAGNVWLLKGSDERPGGKLGDGNFFDQVATGTGFGLRYDLGFLVIRADLGVGIHLPYDTGRNGYYNIPRFRDGLGFHLAIGYPF